MFLLNPLLQGHCRSAPETSRNTPDINQGTNEDGCQGDLHSQARVSQNQTAQVFSRDGSYNMATGVQDEISHSSLGTSSAKPKMARSTSQPQFRSENTPVTIDLDQILLAPQQLASNSNSANFNNNNNNNNWISKLPKPLTTIIDTFDG